MRQTKILLLAVLASLFTPQGSFALEKSAAQKRAYYLSQQQISAEYLAPPPAAGSQIDKADLAALHEWQEKRTAQDCRRALSEYNATFEELFGGISPFVKPLPPEVNDFFERIHKDADAAVHIIKYQYKRPRPYLRDETLKPCLGQVGGYSYPSGHAEVARLFALALSDLVPQRKAEFIARGDECALDRVIGGVHHPSDIEAGKLLGDELYSQFSQNPAFLAEQQALRKYLAK